MSSLIFRFTLPWKFALLLYLVALFIGMLVNEASQHEQPLVLESPVSCQTGEYRYENSRLSVALTCADGATMRLEDVSVMVRHLNQPGPLNCQRGRGEVARCVVSE